MKDVDSLGVRSGLDGAAVGQNVAQVADPGAVDVELTNRVAERDPKWLIDTLNLSY